MGALLPVDAANRPQTETAVKRERLCTVDEYRAARYGIELHRLTRGARASAEQEQQARDAAEQHVRQWEAA